MSTLVSRRIGGTGLADAANVGSALTPDPGSGILVPFVSGIRDRTQRSQDVLPTSLILERSAHGLRDERAALAPTYPAVQLRDKFVFEINVYAHAHNLAHSPRTARYGRGLSSSQPQPIDRQSWVRYVT
jgi:hypothetical protein